jgi:hypothetical protein
MSPRTAHSTRSPLLLSALALILGLVWTSDVRALEGCKAKIAKDGAILVSAKDVSGVLEWGNTVNQAVNSFGNAATCLANGAASKCELGGGAQRITPPELCTIFLADGADTCSAFLKGCTPGVRSIGGGFVSKNGDVMSGPLRAPTIDTGFGVAGCGAGDVCAQARLISEFGGAEIGGELVLHDGIQQGTSNSGVVKAGLIVTCDGTFSSVARFFNTTGQNGPFTAIGEGSNGQCSISMPFPINNRFFVATGLDSSKATVVTVSTTGTNIINVRRSQETAGVLNGDNGSVSILIY